MGNFIKLSWIGVFEGFYSVLEVFEFVIYFVYLVE